MYEPYIQQCVMSPQYRLMERAYNDYRANSRPCQRGATNQCAVRMSIALYRAGFGLESFPRRDRVHSGNGNCETNGAAHVLGALELARFLREALGDPQTFSPARRGRGCAAAFNEIRPAHGIVYFNNCFRREGEATAQGDHIDLFNGAQYFNQILRPRAAGDETTGGDLFGRADGVWFWPLD
jgi:hypothetical protein